MRRALAVLVVFVLQGAAELRADDLGEWCDTACKRLFGPQQGRPKCDLVTFEHQVIDGRIQRVEVPDRECEDLVATWENHATTVKRSRDGVLDLTGCRAWCGDAGSLRGGEPLPDSAQYVWELLADVEVCSTGSLDAQFVSMVPLHFKCNGMAFVPPGKFMMGCVDGRRVRCKDDEKPDHVVYLPGFFIDLHEVTVGAYEMCVKGQRCKPPKGYDLLRFFNWGSPERLLHPVNGVTWEQAQAYCRYDGKRLCTEAEWEKAARGTDGRLYPWGNTRPTEERVYVDDGIDYSEANRKWPILTTTEQVCSRPGGNSPYGLCDMAGNVTEWVSDWYAADYYGKSPLVTPRGPEEGTFKVTRGGRFHRIGFSLRTTSRRPFDPAKDFEYLGFRCCRTFSGNALEAEDSVEAQ